MVDTGHICASLFSVGDSTAYLQDDILFLVLFRQPRLSLVQVRVAQGETRPNVRHEEDDRADIVDDIDSKVSGAIP